MAALNFNSVMIGSEDPKRLGGFYAGVFGRPADMDEGGMYGWGFGATFLSIIEHSDVKGQAAEPQRVILNLETKEVQAEFDRIKAAGATVVKEPYELQGMWIATFADPDGNYFQLVTPWEGPATS
ncbi:MAG: VOC family protein [Actinomycetota bacterium]|nr:VOC family protein [Actinomycetota bacterium]